MVRDNHPKSNLRSLEVGMYIKINNNSTNYDRNLNQIKLHKQKPVMKNKLARNDFTSNLLYNATEQFQQNPQKEAKIKDKEYVSKHSEMACHA